MSKNSLYILLICLGLGASVSAADTDPCVVANTVCKPCKQPFGDVVPIVVLPCHHGIHINCLLGEVRTRLADRRVTDKEGIVCLDCDKPVSMCQIKSLVVAAEKATKQDFFGDLKSHFLFYDAPPSISSGVICLVGTVFFAYLIFSGS